MAEGMISKRAKTVENWEDFLNKYMYMCNDDEYDPSTNPKGFINLGTAVNNLCNDIIHPKITDSNIWQCNTALLQYSEGRGIFRLRKALANLMSVMFETYEPVDPENLFCVIGVTGAIDLIGHCVADPGDIILTPTPVYGRIKTDLLQRSQVEIWPIPIIAKDNKELSPQLTLDKVEEAFSAAIQSKKNVRGILLVNPNNPLGDVYSPELIMSIMKFCQKQELHIIMDEVYALSAFSEEIEFHSTLKFPELPDPQRTHVLYGISKDFAMAGLRIGAIYTKCKPLQNCLKELCFFQDIPFPIMDIGAHLLEDIEWCKEFVSINRERMRSTFKYCHARLVKMNINTRHSGAAFFLWIDLRQVCEIRTFEDEINFFEYLIQHHHLYIVPGSELFCEQPGWFRFCFTGQSHHLGAGLDRLECALKEYPHFKIQRTRTKSCP